MSPIDAPQGRDRERIARGHPSSGTPDVRFVILRDVVICREALDLNKGDVSVLRALLFCLHKSGQTLVFASNDTLSRQADGMPVRTLSRHIGRLVAAGIALRHDSPTKRRYVRRASQGIISGYGIDLAPLFENAQQLSRMAAQIADDTARLKALQDDMSCLANQLLAIDPESPLVVDARRERRRKPDADRIVAMIQALTAALPSAQHNAVTVILATGDSQNGRPDQKAIQEEYSDRLAVKAQTVWRNETLQGRDVDQAETVDDTATQHRAAEDAEEDLHPTDVVHACPEAVSFAAARPLRTWHDIAAFAWDLGGWMNIDQQTIRDAAERLGVTATSAAIMAICQCGARVRSPGAYLRKLSRTPGFSVATFLRRLSSGAVVRGRQRSPA